MCPRAQTVTPTDQKEVWRAAPNDTLWGVSSLDTGPEVSWGQPWEEPGEVPPSFLGDLWLGFPLALGHLWSSGFWRWTFGGLMVPVMGLRGPGKGVVHPPSSVLLAGCANELSSHNLTISCFWCVYKHILLLVCLKTFNINFSLWWLALENLSSGPTFLCFHVYLDRHRLYPLLEITFSLLFFF